MKKLAKKHGIAYVVSHKGVKLIFPTGAVARFPRKHDARRFLKQVH